ncbi:MAG: hypothetical protein ABI064_07730 [Acidobacteriaceae bacterium]
MRFVDALNSVSSQVWAVVLILLGIGTFGMACTCAAADVRAALMSSGTGMIGGGIAMFQHQPKSAMDSNQPPA